MEGELSSLEVLSAMFEKKKKKKKKKRRQQQLDSLGKESPEPLAPAGLEDPVLAGGQSQGTKRKKRKRENPPLSLPLPEAELSPDATGLPSKPPHKKKRKRSALGVDEETGVAYVLVDREDSENVPENFRKDVDVVYVDVSRATAESGAREPPAVGSPPQEEPEELRPRAKKKKKKRPCGMVPDSPQHTPGDSDGVQDSPQATPHHASLGVVSESPCTPRDNCGVQDSPLGTPHHTYWSEVWASPCTPSPLHTQEPCVPPAPLPEREDRKKAKKKKKRHLGSPDSVTPAAIPPEPVGSRSQEDGPVAGKEEAEEGGRKKMEKRKLSALGNGPAGPVPPGNPRHPLLEPEEGLKTAEVERAGLGPGQESPETAEEQPRSKLTDQSQSSVECAQDAESRPLSEGPQDSGDSDVDLGSAVRQLQEFIPDIKDRAATTIRRMYRDDLVRFQEFKAQGVAIKFGKFSVKENKQLEQNVHEFLALTGIESADKLLYTDRYPEEKSAITDLKRKFSFRVHIGKGIARPWKLVYYRAKKMFDVNNYKGRYSHGEVEKLKACHSLHGNNWKKIGEMVARSSLSVALKYSQISSERNRGAWSKTETQKLTKAVEEVILRKLSPQELAEVDSKLQESPERRLSIVREKLYKGISWVEVGARVETRSWMQCKSKWMEVLTRRMTNGQRVYRGANALQAKVNLIERLYEVNVEDANEIDWEDLAGAIGDVPPSYVQTKFYKLKATCVPFWQKKTFPEIIDHLYEVTLPLLKEKLEKVLEKRGTEVQTPAAPKQAFLFRDIFCAEDSEGEEESERS